MNDASETLDGYDANDPEQIAWDEVCAVYMATPEYREKEELIKRIEKLVNDSEDQYLPMRLPIPVSVPKAFYQLWKFVSGKTNPDVPPGDWRRHFREYLVKLIAEQFVEMVYALHEKETDLLPCYRDLWNRACEQTGHTEFLRKPRSGEPVTFPDDGRPF